MNSGLFIVLFTANVMVVCLRGGSITFANFFRPRGRKERSRWDLLYQYSGRKGKCVRARRESERGEFRLASPSENGQGGGVPGSDIWVMPRAHLAE